MENKKIIIINNSLNNEIRNKDTLRKSFAFFDLSRFGLINQGTLFLFFSEGKALLYFEEGKERR